VTLNSVFFKLPELIVTVAPFAVECSGHYLAHPYCDGSKIRRL
jgi:hypothetical protein